MHGVTLDALTAANKKNKSIQILSLHEGEEVWLPRDCSVAVHGMPHACYSMLNPRHCVQLSSIVWSD
jgi:hypothetical protein